MIPLLSAYAKFKTLLAVAVAMMTLMSVVACSTSSEQDVGPTPESPTSTPIPAPTQTTETPTAAPVSTPATTHLLPGEIPLIKGPMSPDGLQAIFGTPDLGVGESRVGFVLTTTDDLVRASSATVSSYFHTTDGSDRVPK
ncbi:MAG: hypothetical protein J4F46_05510, partial [Dehalococcoidia bacterium]|nr:hypothetical protein [Dehalococcoidia bacterium]